ncbi:AsmA-like C-terminal region-containing protein [Lichenicoccus sp.]|uniref:AsmA-like C-terminal region-containing protein n=1 Tax=Lichenicoccus sp. TaxID=2781899 RepID=UPI003D0CC322
MIRPRQANNRWWHVLPAVLLVLISLPVFAALVLGLRLWAGPIDVTGSARRLAAPDLPGLSFAQVQLTWNGWGEGPTAPLGLIVRGLRLDDPRVGHAQVARADVALDLFALLHGRVEVIGLHAADGSIDLAQVPPSGAVQLGSPGGHKGRVNRDRLDLDALRAFELSHVALSAHGLPCRAKIADLRLLPLHRPAAIGVSGRVAASLSCGGRNVAFDGAAREGPQGEIVWHVTTGSFVPSRIGSPLAPLVGLDLPVSLKLDAALSGGFGRLMLPRHLELTAQLGAGTIRGVDVAGGQLHLTLDLPRTQQGTLRAALSPSRVVLRQAPGAATPALLLTGSFAETGALVRARIAARIARVDFAGLGRIWPSALAPGGRRWVTANITAGTGRDLALSATFASPDGWGALHLTKLDGGLDASGLTIFWLRPIAPLRAMDAHLVLEGPDTLRIESRRGLEAVPLHGVITAGPTVLRITGLEHRQQHARIATTLTGGLGDILTLLAYPRLGLLSRHKLPFTDIAGRAVVKLGLSLPLVDTLATTAIQVHADAALSDVHLGDAVLGRALDAGGLALHAENSGLQVAGDGAIGGIPSRLTYSMDFRAGGPQQLIEAAHVSARIDKAALRQAGVWGADSVAAGAAALDVAYGRHRDGAASVVLNADLTDAALDTPVWSKPAGAPAHASAVIGLQDAALVSIGMVKASGEDLAVAAHAEVGGGRPDAIVLDRFRIGRSQGVGRVDLPTGDRARTGPIRVALHGPVLDITPYLAMRAARATGADRAWRADLVFHRVWFTRQRWFSGVHVLAAGKGVRLSRANLTVAGPTPVLASLSPDAGDARRLMLKAPDAGALLAALGVGGGVEGGTLSVVGILRQSRGAGMLRRSRGTLEMTGRAEVGRFVLHDAPLSARLARDLSIYGLLTGAKARQIVITRCELPFTLRGSALHLSDARASNAALGATLRGAIDLGHSTLDLRGTIVPSYLFNALPGKLPGVGRVFSPEQGGGLFALTLRVTGPIDKPVIGVNPLSLLAPGILRRLLFD